MSDADDIEAIREQKRERLERRLREEGGAGDEPVGGPGADAAGESTPSEPVRVGGADELAELVEGRDVVLVDFHADWCGPCQMLEPTVEALAAETPAAVATVDIDENRALAGQYGVRSVPTLLLFAGGEPVERVVGVEEKPALAGLIERYA